MPFPETNRRPIAVLVELWAQARLGSTRLPCVAAVEGHRMRVAAALRA